MFRAVEGSRRLAPIGFRHSGLKGHAGAGQSIGPALRPRHDCQQRERQHDTAQNRSECAGAFQGHYVLAKEHLFDDSSSHHGQYGSAPAGDQLTLPLVVPYPLSS